MVYSIVNTQTCECNDTTFSDILGKFLLHLIILIFIVFLHLYLCHHPMINTMKNITLAVHPLLLHLHDNRVIKPDVTQITTVVDAQQRQRDIM